MKPDSISTRKIGQCSLNLGPEQMSINFHPRDHLGYRNLGPCILVTQ